MTLTTAHLPFLRQARDLIASEEQFFICFAMASVPAADEGIYRDCYAHIEQNLDNQPYLTYWVRDQMRGLGHPWWLQESATSCLHGNDPKRIARREEAVAMQRMMRTCWLDKIIHDIEALPCAS